MGGVYLEMDGATSESQGRKRTEAKARATAVGWFVIKMRRSGSRRGRYLGRYERDETADS